MENLDIKSTPVTPEVTFSFEEGVLSLSGKSIHENPFEFYEQLMDWVEKYSTHPKPHTKILINLEYCNTSSSKCLVRFLKTAAKLKEGGSDTIIRWFYDKEDEDTFDAGNDFSKLVDLPFEFVEND